MTRRCPWRCPRRWRGAARGLELLLRLLRQLSRIPPIRRHRRVRRCEGPQSRHLGRELRAPWRCRRRGAHARAPSSFHRGDPSSWRCHPCSSREGAELGEGATPDACRPGAKPRARVLGPPSALGKKHVHVFLGSPARALGQHENCLAAENPTRRVPHAHAVDSGKRARHRRSARSHLVWILKHRS